MKAIVLSDSHGGFSGIMDIILRERELGNIDLIVHAGDIQADVDSILFSFPDIKCEYVLGNNDWRITDVPFQRLFTFGGKKIFLTHGHKYGVKSTLYNLRSKARDVGADICIFGHTHIPHLQTEDGILMFNPGSSYRTYGVLKIDDNGNIDAEIKQRRG